MLFLGDLHKMSVTPGRPVLYRLKHPEQPLLLNDWLGRDLRLRFTGTIHCERCAKTIPKTFSEGLCYACFLAAPETAPCVMHPEACEAHLGKGKDPAWEQVHHNQPHVVYLALSADLKVGVTRVENIPTRWIDQGAWRVVRLAEVPYRRLAGEMEVFLKDYLTDKTDWRKMLRNELAQDTDLLAEKERIARLLPDVLQDYYAENDEIYEIEYPALAFPNKVSSLSLDKTPEVAGHLIAVKGQYLIFEGGAALNVRKHAGYELEITAG